MERKIRKICIVVLALAMMLNPCIVYADSLEIETENNIESDSGSSENNPEETEEQTEGSDSDVKTENGAIEEGETQAAEGTDNSGEEVSPEEEMNVSPQADLSEGMEARGYQGMAANDTGNTANVVVFVEFADTLHDHTTPERCYLKNPNLTKLFQGDDSNPRAMKKYLQNISYNQLEVANIFPQYDAAADKIDSYALKYGIDHYVDSKNGDTEIIEEIADILASSGQIPSNISLDRDNDGYVDNLMIVVPCESGNTNKKINGHKSNYIGSKQINSKKLSNYTIVPESSVYMSESSGVLIHEFMHTRGYPDLYLVGASDLNKGPVGPWDIMAMANKYVQYPLAYLRSAYTKWFSIPTVWDTTKNYSLYAASAATAQTKDRQAVILKTDYSSTEFFVLEYRKKGVMYNATSASQAYDSLIPDSGLIIYRVDTAVNQGNAQAPPYMTYVFRQNDTYENGYEKADKALLDSSFLSAESGRTSYGSSDINATVTENAICYSDGMNSGIVISNVGNTQGDQITFDITFTKGDQDSKWTLESEDTTGLQFSASDSCRGEDGSIYYISQIGNSSSGNSSALLKYSGGKWNKVADGPTGSSHQIAIYNNEIYVLYRDSAFYVKMDKWNGKSWTNLFKSTVRSNDIVMGKADDGVYFAYTNWDGNTILAYRYSAEKGMRQLGDKLCYSASGSPTNAVISSYGGNTVAVYREAFNNNQVYVQKYDEKTNSWIVLLNGSMQANNAIIEQNGKKLYLLKNGTVFGKNETYLYVYDMSLSNGKWTQVGSNMVMDANALEMNVCFNGSNPYVIYGNGSGKTYARQLVKDQWEDLGLKVSSQQLTGLETYYSAGKVYITYLDITTGRISIRSLQVSAQPEEKPDEKPDEKLEGWQETGGKKYYYEAGKRVTGIKKIGNEIYFFDGNGVCQQSGWITSGTEKYFPKPGGAFYRNQFIAFGSTRYYMGADGSVQKGVVKAADGNLYYADKTTGIISLKAGWIDEGGKKYFNDGTGKLYRNQFIAFGRIRYYMGADGSVQKGIVRASDGNIYYTDKTTGIVSAKAGWIDEGGKRYFNDGTGRLYRNQFISFGKIVYYCGSDGAIIRGQKYLINGVWYTFNADGIRVN